MADVSVQGIEFEVKGNADKAIDALNKLSATLKKLRPESANGGLSKIAETLSKVTKAATRTTSTIAGLQKASASTEKLSASLRRIDGEISHYTQKLEEYQSKKEVLEQFANVKGATTTAEDLAPDIDKYKESITEIEGILDRLAERRSEVLSALIPDEGANTEGVSEALEEATQQSSRLHGALESIRGAFSGLGQAAKAALQPLENIVNSFKRIMFYRIIRTVIKQIGDAISIGMTNAYQFSKAVGGDLAAAFDKLSSASYVMKNQLGAAFATMLQSITPVLIQLINLATKAADALARLFAILNGSGTYLKANTDYMKAWGDETEKTGGAMKELKGQLLGIDELNVLQEPSSGGGGGAAALDYENMFDEMPVGEGMLADFAITLKDVLFKWDEMTPELVASKVLSAVFGVAGAIIGWHLGGIGGAAIGLVVGASFGAFISSVMFDNDGKLSNEEIAKLVLMAVFGAAGGIIGWHFGGLFGAAIGFTITASLGFLMGKLAFNNNGKLSSDEIAKLCLAAVLGAVGAVLGWHFGGLAGAAVGFTITASLGFIIGHFLFKNTYGSPKERFYETDFGKDLAGLKAEVEAENELVLELSARIEGITGNIDAETLANLTLAQKLINDIFSIDESNNLTGPQIEELKLKIETLNSLGLDGLQLSFDETTGHVSQTKEEIQSVMDALLEQYRIEAMRDAYIESYKAQFEATQHLVTENKKLEDALKKYDAAASDAKEAAGKLAAAQKELDDAMNMPQLQGVVEDFSELQQNVYLASLEFNESKIALDETKAAVSDITEKLNIAMGAYEDTTKKVSEITSAFESLVSEMSNSAEPAIEDGKNVMVGFGNGITSGASSAKTAMEEACGLILEAEQKLNGIASPSTVYATEGEFVMQGFANGITNNTNISETAISTAMGAVKTAAETALQIVGGASQVFETIGSYIAQGLANGINKNSWVVESAVKNIMKSAKESAEKTAQIASPSKIFAEIGGYLSLGLAKGITEKSNVPVYAASGMMEDVTAVSGEETVSAISNRQFIDRNDSRYDEQIVNAVYAMANMIVRAIESKDTSAVVSISDRDIYRSWQRGKTSVGGSLVNVTGG